jgi:hypothetical protein
MRFRQGKSVPENIYDDEVQPHKPIMIAANPEIAEHYVRLLNAGLCVSEDDIRDRDALVAAASQALDEMCRTVAPRNSFTDAVDALDRALNLNT